MGFVGISSGFIGCCQVFAGLSWSFIRVSQDSFLVIQATEGFKGLGFIWVHRLGPSSLHAIL